MANNERDTREYSLQERAYRGDDGQIHHHTNTYMEQHGASGGSSSGSGSRSGDRGGSDSRGGSGGRSESRSASGGGESRGGSDSRRDEGERSEGGMGRTAMIAAGVVGVAAVAAAAVVAARRGGGMEVEVQPGAAGTPLRDSRAAEPGLDRVDRTQGDGFGGGSPMR